MITESPSVLQSIPEVLSFPSILSYLGGSHGRIPISVSRFDGEPLSGQVRISQDESSRVTCQPATCRPGDATSGAPALDCGFWGLILRSYKTETCIQQNWVASYDANNEQTQMFHTFRAFQSSSFHPKYPMQDHHQPSSTINNHHH